MQNIDDSRQILYTCLDEIRDEFGSLYLEETVYRFSIAQFQKTLGFTPAPRHLILKVLSEALDMLGQCVEKIAAAAFDAGIDEQELNRKVGQWLVQYMKEKQYPGL